VQAVGANTTRLLTGGRWDSSITIPGARTNDRSVPWSFFNAVTPGYFAALGIPVKAGRDFTWNDWGSAQARCLVNEALVSEYLDGESPVGKMMAQGRDATPNMEIIGVFANSRYENVRGRIPRQTFVAMGGPYIRFASGINVFARTGRDPRQMFSQFRETVRGVDSNLVVFDMRMLNDQVNMRLSQERMLSFLSAGFALLATLLAVVGLYGVLAFVVARRTREIGIRMALGARRGAVIRLVLLEMMTMVIFGLAVGVTAGILSGKYVESQLFGVQPSDPFVYFASVTILLAAATAAAFFPAWRAARIEPVRALRHE
jgi:predicted permease